MNQRVVKIARNILFLLSIPLIISAFVFAQKSSTTNVCKSLNIQIENSDLSFITKKDIINIIQNAGIESNKTLIHTIDIHELENTLNENKWISKSTVFVGANHSLTIQVQQKRPLVRIVSSNIDEDDYYLDEFANPISLSNQYYPRLPAVTCRPLNETQQDLDLKSDLVTLSIFLQDDSFWNAAITQINVGVNDQLELIPAFGNQIIILGNIDDLDNKFERLLLFYKQGLNTIDWSLYDELDLRFIGQIIGRNKRGEILSKDPYAKIKIKPVILQTTNNTNSINKTLQVNQKVDASTIKKKEEAKQIPKQKDAQVIKDIPKSINKQKPQ